MKTKEDNTTTNIPLGVPDLPLSIKILSTSSTMTSSKTKAEPIMILSLLVRLGNVKEIILYGNYMSSLLKPSRALTQVFHTSLRYSIREERVLH